MQKEVGHNFLARLGKKRLRPGGVTATNWLIEEGEFSQDKKVLDVACNMCTTSIELAKKYHCQIIGVDRDKNAIAKAKENIAKEHLSDYIHVEIASAFSLPFEDNTFDIIINEAMLTMLNQNSKEKAVKEYYRVLKPGGKLLTHDIAVIDNFDETIIKNLSTTINMNVNPLPEAKWEELFTKNNFKTIKTNIGKMTLMSPQGMLKDEGLFGTIKIISNGRKAENKEMFTKMSTFFREAKKDLKFIAVSSTK